MKKCAGFPIDKKQKLDKIQLCVYKEFKNDITTRERWRERETGSEQG